MIEYKKATIEDMGEVAQLHIACFPEYFLTKLDGGKGVLLKEFYKCALGDKKIFILAKKEEKIVGFVMGYIPPFNPREEFERSNFWLLSRHMIRLLVRFNKMAWARVFARIKDKFVKTKPNNEKPELKGLTRSGLLSICVLPEFRGTGISIRLIEEYEKESLEMGADYYTLSALKANERGNAFYRKIGLKIKNESKDEIYYYKMLGDGDKEIDSKSMLDVEQGES